MRFGLLLIPFLCLVACATSPARPDADVAQTDPKQIALTYDDAPRSDGRLFTGVERTQALLAQFEQAKTGPVAIFVTTRGLDRDDGKARIQAYDRAGHRIANHSHTHPWASRTESADFLRDIDEATTRLDGLGPLNNRRPWFRFPYLDEGGYGPDKDRARQRREELRTALSARDLRNGYVTVDTYDWHLEALLQSALRDGKRIDKVAVGKFYADMIVEAAEHYDRMAMDVLGRRPAQTLLLHENDLAAAFTVEMVAGLRAAGWEIIDPDAAYRDPIARDDPDTLFAGMGRVAAIAHDKGRRGADYFDHWSSNEAEIEARATAAGLFQD
jgi:peptidoglycan/xylan/chitin deacetylase (PgdA/CDA1 family)